MKYFKLRFEEIVYVTLNIVVALYAIYMQIYIMILLQVLIFGFLLIVYRHKKFERMREKIEKFF